MIEQVVDAVAGWLLRAAGKLALVGAAEPAEGNPMSPRVPGEAIGMLAQGNAPQPKPVEPKPLAGSLRDRVQKAQERQR